MATYCVFIEDLFNSGMVEFTDKPQGLVTPFCVTKKSGKLRLILDCRDVNQRLKPPPSLALGTGASWSRIHIPAEQQLFIAQSDLKDYFSTLQLPVSLRRLFSLPAVPSILLRQWNVGAEHGGQLPFEGWAHPMLRVIPMGWSWAMWFSQRVHQYQAQLGAGVTIDRVLVDGKAAPDLASGEVLLLPYADNLNIAGTDERRVQEAKDGAVKRLREVGLLVHEELEACNTAQSLGFLIDGKTGRVSPVPDRLYRVQLAFRWLSRRPRVSGRAVQRLLGHAVHFMMLKRSLLSIPRRLYDFIQYAGQRKCRLWTGAAVEAKWLATLLPLCSADLRKQLSGTVTASDASLSGIAVCSKNVEIDDIKSMSSVRENWRYKGRDPASRPRFQALSTGDPFSDVSTVKPIHGVVEDPFELDVNFKEIPIDFMNSEEWSLRFAQHMQYPEHITALEGRGVVASLRHKFRSTNHFGKEHFHLCDNLGMVLALDKGRSSSMSLLRTCRRVCCLLIATGSVLSCRWIPSEINVADHGSRKWESLRIQQAAGGPKKAVDAEGLIREDWPAQHHDAETFACNSESAADWWQSETGSSIESASTNKRRESREETELHEAVNSSGSFSGPNVFGAACSFSGGSNRLHESNAAFQGFCSKPVSSDGHHSEHRQQLHRISERYVCRWKQSGRGHQKPRSSHRPRARLWPKGSPPPGASLLARMAEIRSRGHEASHSNGTGVSPGFEDVGKEPCRSCCDSTADVRGLPASRGGTGSERRGFSHANSCASISQFESTSLGSTGVIKSGALRRDHSTGLKFDAMVGGPLDNKTAGSAKCLDVSHDLPGPQERLDEHPEGNRTASRPRRALSTEAFRSIIRQIDQEQIFAGCEEAWSLVCRLFSETLRSSCKTSSRVPEVAKKDPTKMLSGSETTARQGPKFYHPPAEKDLGIWVVEVFSGSAHLSRAMAQQGFRVAAWDIDSGIGCDVMLVQNLQRLLKFLCEHRIALVWFGMPCQSWSMARRWDGGPPPLRDDSSEIWGRTFVSMKDAEKIQSGNQLLSWTFLMVCILNFWQLPWVVENPWTSRAWKTSPFRHLCSSMATLHQVDYCQYNMPWRKSTGLMTSLFPGLTKILRCCATRNGRCSATHKRHITLSGKDSQGVYWTLRAQPYPKALCRDIAVSLARSYVKG